MVELDFEPKLQITMSRSQLTEKQFKKSKASWWPVHCHTERRDIADAAEPACAVFQVVGM